MLALSFVLCSALTYAFTTNGRFSSPNYRNEISLKIPRSVPRFLGKLYADVKIMETAESTKLPRKRIYEFHEGTANDKMLLGNKGANLCEMTRLGLNVPPGFIISTEACNDYFHSGCVLPTHLEMEYIDAVHDIEKKTDRIFANSDGMSFPLLLSVRSGAAASMPGMMDTVLNLGLNDDVVQGIILHTRNPRFAYDTYRRFLQMFGTVVLGIDHERYEFIIDNIKKELDVTDDVELDADALKRVAEEFKFITRAPEDPWVQLKMAVEAVFSSWFSPRAKKYRKFNNIPDDLGTAVNIQSMVYGNMNSVSGTGVAFTRNPGTGDKVFYGEYLSNAEGEDVVAGIRTPMMLEDLRRQMPNIYDELCQVQTVLENHFRDMQAIRTRIQVKRLDIEFTVESGILYILQTRNGKRTARVFLSKQYENELTPERIDKLLSIGASVKMAVDMVDEGLITRREALLRLDASKMSFFLHQMVDPSKVDRNILIGEGLPASAGAATGMLCFSSEEAEEMREKGKRVILVRQRTSPEDIGGLRAAEGVLTMYGGMTSHAAVVARGMGKCAITGAGRSGMTIDEKEGTLTSYILTGPEQSSKITLKRGDVRSNSDSNNGDSDSDGGVLVMIVTLDGSTGSVYEGTVATLPAGEDANYVKILTWADKYKRMSVYANADTPDDVRKAVEFGAEGLGLCRTEHMFFHPDRIDIMRAMILSENKDERESYLDQMESFQMEDFLQVFRLMEGKEVVVRLLDPPLHEFLPDTEIFALADRLHMDRTLCLHRVNNLKEINPMLGFRGCRISVVYPEITAMQTRAILGAAVKLKEEKKMDIKPEIMIPL
eukprot:gene4386-8730_t